MLSSSFGALRVSSLRLASIRSPILALPIPRQRLLSTLVLSRCQRPQTETQTRWRNARWNSSAAGAGASSEVPIITSPPPPTLPPTESSISDLDLESVTSSIASIPPLQPGDLHALGFCHWTPPGLIQYSFEVIHVLSGLPWFHTFVAATLFWRLVIFPFSVIGAQHSARLRPVQKQMSAASEAVAAARAAHDTVAMQRASAAATKLRAEAGATMLGLMAPMVQFPISIGLFLGVKKMCDLPVQQLTESGFAWLPDLTQPGPYYILPILVAASGNLMITMGRRDMDPTRPALGHMMNAFRILSVVGILWMQQFPSGLLVCLVVTSLTSILQTAIIRNPTLRAKLNIPPWVPMPSNGETLPTMRDTFREYVYPGRVASKSSAKLGTDRVKAYIPPGASEPLRTATIRTAPIAPAPPASRTLEVIAQQAQADPSVKSSSLYELSDKPAPTTKAAPTAKAAPKAKAVKKAKAKRA